MVPQVIGFHPEKTLEHPNNLLNRIIPLMKWKLINGTSETIFFLKFINISLPSDIVKKRKIINEIYDYLKSYLENYNNFPVGEKTVIGNKVIFPSKTPRRNSDYRKYKIDKCIREHISQSTWEKIVRTRMMQGFANQQRYNEVKKYVEDYLLENKHLPTGRHEVGDFFVDFAKTPKRNK